MYDDSENDWTESVIVHLATSDGVHIGMDAAVRHSDSHILLVFHGFNDDPSDDLITYDLTVDDIDTPTWSQGDQLFTNVGEQAQVAIFINQQNDDVYIAWLSGGTWESSVDVVYKKSTDGMDSWGAEQSYSEDGPVDFRGLQAGRTVGDSGGRYQPIFYNDDSTDIWVNLTNDIEFAPPDGGTIIVQNDNLLVPGRNRSM